VTSPASDPTRAPRGNADRCDPTAVSKPVMGLKPACVALVRSRAGSYRRHRSPLAPPAPPAPAPSPSWPQARTLTILWWRGVLAVPDGLNHVDEGIGDHVRHAPRSGALGLNDVPHDAGGRRGHRAPASGALSRAKKPELLATAPNEICRLDITKL
jgi:hypothetical protein